MRSVFWENFLAQRPLSAMNISIWQKVLALFPFSAASGTAVASSHPWIGLEGPTRVINLLQCHNLLAFQANVISTFNPPMLLPNFTFRPEPTFDSTIELLKIVLPLIKETPLIVYCLRLRH